MRQAFVELKINNPSVSLASQLREIVNTAKETDADIVEVAQVVVLGESKYLVILNIHSEEP